MKSQNFAILIRSTRENLGLTQSQLAKLSGISVRTIKKIENDGYVPRSKLIDQLRDVLKIEDKDWVPEDVLILKYNFKTYLNRGHDVRHILRGMLDTPDDYIITIQDILKMLEIEEVIGRPIDSVLVTVLFKNQKKR